MTDWSTIITRGYESKELDYKGPMSWDTDDKASCCKLVKDILALANSKGGWLVIGVSEQNGEFVPKGLTEAQAVSFESTRVNQFLKTYAEPPINATVVRVTHAEKIFIIIQIPPFPDTPHICQQDFRQERSEPILKRTTLYVRTDSNESAALENSADFRALVERATSNRIDQLLTHFRTILKHGSLPERTPDTVEYNAQVAECETRYASFLIPDNGWQERKNAYRTTAFYPARFQNERFDIGTLRAMAAAASIDLRGWPFIFLSPARPKATYAIESGLETFIACEKLDQFGTRLHFWQLRRSGLLFVKERMRELRENTGDGEKSILDFDAMSFQTADAVNSLSNLYKDRLDDDEEVVLRFSLVGVDGWELGSSNPSRDTRPGHICRSDTVSFTAQHPLADWRAGVVDHALKICKHMFQMFNWDSPNLGESRKLMENMLARKL